MKHRGIQISFLVLCAEIVEFIISYCFTDYVNFFDLKLNYFVNSFFSLYRNVLYDSVQKKKRLIAPRSSQLYSLCISIENQGLFQLQIFACCLQKVFVLKTLKKMRYYVINYNGRNINKTLGTSKLITLALTVNIFM